MRVPHEIDVEGRDQDLPGIPCEKSEEILIPFACARKSAGKARTPYPEIVTHFVDEFFLSENSLHQVKIK
jgi:hypothetical protein